MPQLEQPLPLPQPAPLATCCGTSFAPSARSIAFAEAPRRCASFACTARQLRGNRRSVANQRLQTRIAAIAAVWKIV